MAGKGSSTDIIEASAKAYLNCLNRYLFGRREARKTKRAPKKKRAAAGWKRPVSCIPARKPKAAGLSGVAGI